MRIDTWGRGLTIHTGHHPVSVDIYNSTGRQVRRITDFGPTLAWDGTTTHGTVLPAGCYVVRVKSGELRRATSFFLVGR